MHKVILYLQPLTHFKNAIIWGGGQSDEMKMPSF